MTDAKVHPASYKDPAGFIFKYQNTIYRQVNKRYAHHYARLKESGLYDVLIQKKWLIPHTEINENLTGDTNWHKTLQPEYIPFISYPYEWSFDMLKDAALLTLKINKKAIEHGMILKDATPFNIQFHHGKPVFIDSLSFEEYNETRPWIAYRQFCECFLFPLYISHYTKTDAQKWLTIYPDGITAYNAAQLLPLKSRFSLGVWMHVFLQSNIQKKEEQQPGAQKPFNKTKLLLLLNGLKNTVEGLKFNARTSWGNYYTETIISQSYLKAKEVLFRSYLSIIPFRSAIDLGANNGFFSKIIGETADWVIAADFDSESINSLYQHGKTNNSTNILPLISDFTNPAPAVGFANKERASFLQRSKADLLTGLALIHHLAISKNLPLNKIAEVFSEMCDYAIIEFVPKEDEKVQHLLKNREDIYPDYTEESFVKVFSSYFTILKKDIIPGTSRILFALKRNQ